MKLRTELPPRYSESWQGAFEGRVLEKLRPGDALLDLGSGRHPAIPPSRRPDGIEYVGLDLSQDELDAAEPGGYDETIAADATTHVPALAGRFDVVVSWQVLEHVEDFEATLKNIHSYLKPGGLFVALFSGSWSAFAVINRLLPNRVGHRIVDRVMKRTENNIPVFPAYYDRCSSRAFTPLLDTWTSADIRPLYFGATYFHFSPVLQRIYLAYENVLERRRVSNLATHYLIRATR